MAKAPRSLAGKVCAVTGGARGIGRATAAALIAQGARVAIGDIDAPLAAQTAQELGSGTLGLPLDVTDRASFTAFIADVESTLGPLDVLVNNAGIMTIGPFLAESDAAADRMIDINLKGVIIGSKLALERFRPRGRGHLVNIASVAGKGGFPGGASYCATKHAVVGLTEAIRAESRGSGIDFSIVMPVGVNTELYSGVSASRGIATPEPEDVADAIVEALQTGRVNVYVPRRVDWLFRMMYLVPRSVSDFFVRILKADRLLLDADPTARRAYEQRVTAPPAQAPALAAAPAPVPAAVTGSDAAGQPVGDQPADHGAGVLL
jgi:NAD(P)-dependent dehydrogenase (short-subunit alcohol dehydrogenase family)